MSSTPPDASEGGGDDGGGGEGGEGALCIDLSAIDPSKLDSLLEEKTTDGATAGDDVLLQMHEGSGDAQSRPRSRPASRRAMSNISGHGGRVMSSMLETMSTISAVSLRSRASLSSVVATLQSCSDAAAAITVQECLERCTYLSLDAETVSAVVSAMHAHAEASAVVHAGCSALTKFMQDEEADVGRKIQAAEAVPTIVPAMRLHAGSAPLTESALRVT